MSAILRNFTVEGGFFIKTFENGDTQRIAITDILRAADVPDLNIDSLSLLTKLAEVVEVIVKTLYEQGVLTDTLIAGYDMSYVLETLLDEHETDIGD